MRVTNSMMVSNFMNNLNNNMGKMSQLQSQLASNRKYAHISDDPVSVIYSQQARYKLNRLSLYQANVSMAQSWLTQTETSLMELNSVIQSAYESCIDASTDVKGGADRETVSKYVAQLRDHVLTILNSTFGDKYVFGGHNTTGHVQNGTVIPPFGYMEVVELDGLSFGGMETAVGGQLDFGSLSVTYTPPLNSLNFPSGSSHNISFSYSVDENGVCEVKVFDGGTELASGTATLEGLAAGDTVEIDLGDYGKVSFENTHTADAIAFKESYGVTVPFGDSGVSGEINIALGALASDIQSGVYSGNAPGTFDLTFAASAGAGYNYTSGVDGGAPGDFTVGYIVSDNKLSIYIETPDGNRVMSNEQWEIDTAAGASSSTTFTIDGFGTVTLDYANGATGPVLNDSSSADITGQQAMDFSSVSTSVQNKPVAETSVSTTSRRALTYNGLDLSDPANASMLSVISKQVPTFDIGLGIQMQVSENGADFMQFGDPPTNIYNLLDSLTRALESGAGVEEINKFIKPLQDSQNHILSVVADVGGRTSRLELMESRYVQDNLNYTQMKSDAEDADQAELIMYYKMAEAVYQAALATGAYIIQPTLMDFLR